MTRLEPNQPEEQATGPGYRAWTRFLWLAVLLVLVAVAVRSIPVTDGVTHLLEWVRGLGIWGPVILMAVYIVATVFMAPGLLLTLGAGALFGVVAGTITASVGSLLGATAAFLLGRYLARDFIDQQTAKYPKFDAIDQAVQQSGFKIVLLTRLSPLFPFNVINYLYGATRVRLRDYVLASWIGMLPGTLLYVYLGHAAGSLAGFFQGSPTTGSFRQAMFVVGLLATVVVTVTVTRIASRALSQAAQDSEQPA